MLLGVAVEAGGMGVVTGTEVFRMFPLHQGSSWRI